MAKGNITGLSIDLGMDTRKVTEAAKTVKSDLSLMNSEMKKNMSAFDRSEKSVEKFSTRLGGLEKKLGIQERAVSSARSEYELMVKQYGEGSEQAKKAERNLNNQEASYNNLERATGNARKELEAYKKEQEIANSKWTVFGEKLDLYGDKMVKFGSGMKDVGKKMTLGITTPIIAGITASIKSFADLEQAVGGVETLFKDSADTVIKNSESAYKRAGVSGVDYMENVTSFSATLLQGLEGDTEAAAKAADMAMVDMSDNANKFGTNIGDVQNAYQGFAKDNFTMLDNLKLGYGGTAGEMARLVNESGVLGDAMDVTAETVKDVPFDQMIEAIHEVQTEMGVTGTTVKEAEETVSGSFGMMKASFMDLSAGFGQEGANIEGLFENLWSSVGTFTDNIKRVLGTMWDNLPLAGWQKWLGAITVAMGPLLAVGGTVVMFLGGVFRAITPVTAAIAKAGGLLSWLKLGFAALTGPIGITIGVIALLGTAFTVAYAKSETFRNFIDGLKVKFTAAWEKAIEFKDKVVQAISGVTAMFTGDWLGGRTILQKLGMSEEQILGVENTVLKVRKFFHDMKEKVNSALSEVGTFFKSIFTDIKDWWDTDGTLIFSAIKTTVSTALTFVVDLFNRFKPIVLGIWNAIFPVMHFIIKMVWEKIKLVVGIGMDVIQGIISGVSALIEGDWSRFGQILKDTALSIWNRVTEFFGNMKNNALELFNKLTGGAVTKFLELKDKVIGKVIAMKDGVVNKFTALKDGAINRITSTYNSVTGKFESLKSSVSTKASNLKNNVTSRFTELKDNSIGRVKSAYTGVTGWFGDIKSSVSTTVTNIKDDTVGKFTGMKDGAVEGVQKLYNGASGIFDDVKDYAKDTFQNMVDGAKALPGNIGDAIKGAASKAVDGVKSLGNKMGEKLGSVVNGVTGGLNKMLGAIGLGKGDLIPDIDIPTFSTGTRNGRLSSDTLGVVNDRGPGNGRGGATQELIERNGSLFMPQGKDAIVPLKKGDRIYSGAETQSLMSSGLLPNFSQGTGSEGGSGGKKKGLLGTLTDVVKNVWGYIQDPGKAFSALMDSVTANFDGMDGFAGKMLSGGWNMLTNGIKGFISKIFKDNEGALGSGQGGKWMNFRMTTPYSPNSPVPGYPTGFNGGRHYGIDYGTPRGTPITATTSGKLSSFWNEGGGKIAKLVTGQLRQFFMHMQTVKPNGNVKKGDVIGKTGNSGRWTTGPHVHWQAQQGTDALNTSTIDPRKVLSNHRKGGILQREGMFWGAEGNKEEVVIPLHRPSEAMKLMNYVASKMGGGSKQTSSVPNVPRGNDNETVEALKQIIANQQEQIKQNTELIKIALGIEDKTGITENQIGRTNDRYNDRHSSKHSVKTGRFNYNV